ncbi:aldo/keto reductase [Amphibacillus xylanus]|uniref:Putative D-arabinose 1-dehydrogenase n=1 Tax=Amphibacillus xylanus (strain ATCC 51415 / DSM 6626 / JCM 7361 / LMG 17667 / NBRC 15112 / Ep01) TaxID=698758 RepID=K0IVQ5_AMPXN|nr:aldo/keto reductase [Amphibacillus xylanus]BAM46510.1 putative D-arabinose 1-dehydrogenase [Amphibacillus xylanus NBRC 15112]
MKYRKLKNIDMDVSILSYGASSLGSVFKEINESEGIRTVHEAIDLGINLIDVSPYYGLTKAENVLGKALQDIPRDKYFLSSKAGRYGEHDFDFSRKSILTSVEDSLKRLNTDYLDILLLHDIEFGSFDEVMEEGIPALHELKKAGKIRYFGVSAYPLEIFKRVLAQTDLDLILSYCHYSLNDQSLLDLIPFLEEKKVDLINASPLSMGLLSSRGGPPEWHPADDEIKRVCQEAANYCKEQGADIAKLAIQFAVSNELIPTTLVSTANPTNMRHNIQWATEPIDEQLLHAVLTILKPIHNKTW